MTAKPIPHCVDLLRNACKQDSRRAFIARGANIKRCNHCLMAESSCFCHLRTPQASPIEFILLFHRDEIHKPTNSGRLIADLFPHDTQAYLWRRTEPSPALLDHLKKQQGHCTLLFPNTQTAQAQQRPCRAIAPETHQTKNKHTFIILDGSWKQASKMFHQSTWLKHIPHLEIHSATQRSFLVRHASHDRQFATAEVTALLLDFLGHPHHSQHLLNYYQAFNEHCLKSRKRGKTQP